MDRKRRDTDSQDQTDSKQIEDESSLKNVTKRSNEEEMSFINFDDSPETTELLEGSENNEDIQRRTRQLRPSIISGPWRVSNGANYRAIDFTSGRNFPFPAQQQSGQYYKGGDGRFYQTQSHHKDGNDFSPVISTYSNKNNFNFDSFKSQFSGFDDSTPKSNQEATSKYKQSSKIPAQNLAFLPVLYTFNPFESKNRNPASTTEAPSDDDGPENYSYFHLGDKPTPASSSAQGKSNGKTFAFPITNLPSTTRNPFASIHSVGGFFNNQSPSGSGKFGFAPIKPDHKPNTPAPIYEHEGTASSANARYNPTTPRYISSTPFPDSAFVNNLKFNQPSNIFSFNIGDQKNNFQSVEKVVEITTKSPVQQYQIPVQVTSTPKYNSFPSPTPSGILDFDRFIASIRSAQKAQANSQLVGGISNTGSSFKNVTNFPPKNNHPYEFYNPTKTTSTTQAPKTSDEYYYDEEDEDVDTKTVVRIPVQKPATYNSYNPKKPAVLESNNANSEYEYYYDDDDDEAYKPPAIKPKYTPLTETMAPRPYNMTTPRPYVSGFAYSTHAPLATSSVPPPIIQFPEEDVFRPIRPNNNVETAPAVVYINKSTQKPFGNKYRPTENSIFGKSGEVTQKTTKINKITTSTTTTTARPLTTRKYKPVKIYKPSTKLVTTTTSTVAPSTSTKKTPRVTTRRKVYTIKPNQSRGQSRFKTKSSTKRPNDSTNDRLELDENLPNR